MAKFAADTVSSVPPVLRFWPDKLLLAWTYPTQHRQGLSGRPW